MSRKRGRDRGRTKATTPQTSFRVKAIKAIRLCLVTSVQEFDDPQPNKFFAPVYCHQFSGEWIKGYSGLSILLYFAADSLHCYVDITWEDRREDPSQRTDLDKILQKWLIGGYTQDREVFKNYVREHFKI